MTKVGIISDTHGLLRESVKERLRDCDYIIHAGDVDKASVVEELSAIAPLYIVRGNADANLSLPLKFTEQFQIEGISFELVHNKKSLPVCQPDTQIVVYGHTHKYAVKRDANGVLWLNPGCCGKRRIHQDVTMMIILIEDGKYEVKRVALEDTSKTDSSPASVQKEDVLPLIRAIVKRMDRNEPIESIAQKLGLSVSFVEMICRIKVTHPGVTDNGIYDKLEVNALNKEKISIRDSFGTVGNSQKAN